MQIAKWLPWIFTANRWGPRRFGAMRTVFALILREMATTYGKSPGGYLWAVLEPVAGIALLTFVFALAFQQPPLGTNFPLFYAGGYLVFMMYLNVSNKLTVAIRFSKPLLFYPAVRFTDAVLARFVLNWMTEVLVLIIVISGILVFWSLRPGFDIPAMVLGILMAAVLALGVGVLNCFLVSVFPIWERIWAIVNRPLFIISTLFFLFETVPHPYDNLLWFNPLVHVVGQMRLGMYPTYAGDFVSPIYVCGLGLGCLALGLLFLNRYYRDIINS
ncbi:MAG: ABC transporter permease [Planktomarina sp.]